MKTFIVAALAFTLTGCIKTELQTRNGTMTFKSQRVMSNVKIGNLEISTNGTVRLHGYGSETAEMLEAVSKGAAEGAVKGVGK